MNLLALPSTHSGRFRALVVDVSPEVDHVWLRRLLRLLNCGIDLGFGILVELLNEKCQ